jgi:hypothetical protein
MAMYTPQEATLGSIKGEGYTFMKRTFRGKEFQGVFFGTEEDLEDLEALLEKEEVRFKGISYKKLKSGKTTKKKQSFLVNVKQLLSVRAGERVDFEVVAEV